MITTKKEKWGSGLAHAQVPMMFFSWFSVLELRVPIYGDLKVERCTPVHVDAWRHQTWSSPRWFVTQGPSKWYQQCVPLDRCRIQQSNWESWLWDGPGFESWVHPPAVLPLGTYSISLDLSVLICKQEPKILTVPLIGLLWKLCSDELSQISIVCNKPLQNLVLQASKTITVLYFLHESAVWVGLKKGGSSLLCATSVRHWRAHFPDGLLILSTGCLSFLTTWQLGSKKKGAKRIKEKYVTFL